MKYLASSEFSRAAEAFDQGFCGRSRWLRLAMGETPAGFTGEHGDGLFVLIGGPSGISQGAAAMNRSGRN